MAEARQKAANEGQKVRGRSGLPEVPGVDGLGSKSLKDVLEGGVKGVPLVDQRLGAAGEQVAGQIHLTHQLLVTLGSHQRLEETLQQEAKDFLFIQ